MPEIEPLRCTECFRIRSHLNDKGLCSPCESLAMINEHIALAERQQSITPAEEAIDRAWERNR